jgi:C-terminal processing protease CtpA/Prc
MNISVEVGSVACDNGLRVGDQIIDVNGTSFFNIRHCQAVETLRSAGSLSITVVVSNCAMGMLALPLHVHEL